MIRYVHGSEDSLDLDVVYVFDAMPEFKKAQEFCSDPEENRNIITIENGVVRDCFKGTADELNNGIFTTYHLHEQPHPLLIERLAERDILFKSIRVARCLLSHISRTEYRESVKKALRSPSWKERLYVLGSVQWNQIESFGEKGNREDILKVLAFQLGQILGLFDKKEFYTKSSVAEYFPELRKYLYREKGTELDALSNYIGVFIEKMQSFETEENNEYAYFSDFNKKINLKTEKLIP